MAPKTKMTYRRLGSSGLQLSVLSFGSWVSFDAQMKDDLALECMQAAYDGKNPTALKTLVAGGAKPFRMPKEVMDAAFKAAFGVYAELSAANPAWKRIYSDYINFLREQNLWFRFTESTFDSYMQSQRIP